MHLPPRILGAAVAIALASWSASQIPAQAADPRATLGVYAGAANVAGVSEWEQSLGGTGTARVMDFLEDESWAKLEAPTWWARTWAASAYGGARIVYSVPLLPATGGTLAEGAQGAYDEHFRELAQTLIAKGQGEATLRLGWEFNGGWYRWRAAADPTAFVGYWRRIVSAMRGVPGAAFRFDWCPNLSKGEIAPDQVYPGDDVVDYIGVDVYDAGWGPNWQDPEARWNKIVKEPYGLAWQAAFAAEHHKQLSFPEWGLTIRPDGHGGGDDPYYVQQMHDWIEAHDVAYSIYFDRNTPGVSLHTLSNFPTAAVTFESLFGAAPAAEGPSGGETGEGSGGTGGGAPEGGAEGPAPEGGGEGSTPPAGGEGSGGEGGSPPAGGGGEGTGPPGGGEESTPPQGGGEAGTPPPAGGEAPGGEDEPAPEGSTEDPAGEGAGTPTPGTGPEQEPSSPRAALARASLSSTTTGALSAAAARSTVRGARRAAPRLSYAARAAGAWTSLRALRLKGVPEGARIVVSCTGGGCPARGARVRGSGSVAIALLHRRWLYAGAVVRIRVRAPGLAPRTFELAIRRGRAPRETLL